MVVKVKEEAKATSSNSLESNRQRETIDVLRSHGVDKYVELPQIAVMGDTSSGKSSVLSSLSGFQFPSSDKLCTRCPTQLQLKKADSFCGVVYIQRYDASNDSADGLPSAENHRTLTCIEDVPVLIEEMTEIIISGSDNSISDDAIVIQAEGPKLPNLTLIDLPGFVRAVGDSEDASIIPRIRALVHRYMTQERTIILAVVPSNVDMHNTEILQAAKEADPDGHRTISVLTKPDLVDKGAEGSVIELLENRKMSLKLGYHAVRCRGQQDLNNGISIAEGLKAEETFFATHPELSKVDKGLVGTRNLIRKLSNLLEDHIEKSLPQVREEIRSQLKECQKGISAMGPPLDSTSERRRIGEASLRSLEQTIISAIKGTYNSPFFTHYLGKLERSKNSHEYDPRLRAKIAVAEVTFRDLVDETRVVCLGNLRKGDKVLYNDHTVATITGSNCERGKFEMDIGQGNTEIIDMSKLSLPTGELEETLRKNRGEQLSIFPNYTIFTRLVASYCDNWLKPMDTLSAMVKLEVKTFLKKAIAFDLPPSYSRFRDMIEERTFDYVEKCISAMEAAMTSEMNLESVYPSTLNHYLFDTLIKLRTEPLVKAFEGMSDDNGNIKVEQALAVLKNFGVGCKSNEKQEAIEMQFALAAYMKVAKKRFIDAIPRIIQSKLLRPISEEMLPSMHLSDAELGKVLVESASTVSRRQELRIKQASLEAAEKAVSFY